MNNKKWIKIWATIILIVVLSIGGFNYVVDPYGSNNKIQKDWNLIKLANTKRALAYKLPLIENGNIDILLLGTSKVGVMDADIVNKYYKGNVFILSSPASLAEEQYYIFKYALKFNNIKTLIYGVELMSFNGMKKEHTSDFKEHKNSIKEYKDISNSLVSYISIDTLKYSIKMMFNKKETYYSIDGQRHYPSIINSINNNTFKFKYNINTVKDNTQYNPYKFSYSQLEYFKKIQQLCKDNNIKLIAYSPPMYYKHFLNIYENIKTDYLLFKTELANLTNYFDFTGVNEISKYSKNYYDEAHVRKEITENILSSINSVEKENLVTKKFLKKHLQNIDQEYEDNKKFLYK